MAAETTDSGRPTRRPPHRWLRTLVVLLGGFVGAVVIAAVAIDLAILIVPAQTVHLLGQTVRVGAVRPSLDLAGPGQVVLFSQTLDVLPGVDFPGLVRPLVSVTKLSPNSYLGELTDGNHPRAIEAATSAARHALATGWLLYFTWIAVVSAVIAGTLALLVHRGVTRHHVGANLRYGGLVLATVLLLLFANLGIDYHVGRQAFTDPHLADRFFDRSSIGLPPPASETDRTTQIAVLGDSTQSGEGLTPDGEPNSPARLCGRSPDAAAAELGATGLAVTNLACSGATIAKGIMGGQVRRGRTISPQLSALESMPDVKFVVVGVGADDLGWSAILKACVGLQSCDNEAVTATFDDYLQQFVQNYYRLLDALQRITARLDHRAVVVIDQYYDPFGAAATCTGLRQSGWPGLTAAKVAFLSRLLDKLNSTLEGGAKAAGFSSVEPDFDGNQVCDPEPYVQGLGDRAPFHPNALGQMKLAMSNLAAFPSNWRAIAAGVAKPKSIPPGVRPAPSASPSPSGSAADSPG